jgi:hypothetical protein
MNIYTCVFNMVNRELARLSQMEGGEILTFQYMDMMANLSIKQKQKQILYDAVANADFDLAKEVLELGEITIKDAIDFTDQDNLDNSTLPDYALIQLNDDHIDKYTFLRENGYTAEEMLNHRFNVLDIVEDLDVLTKKIEHVEASMVRTNSNTLLWSAAKKISDIERNQLQHLEELKEIVNTAKLFNK